MQSLQNFQPELEYLDNSIDFKSAILSSKINVNIGPFYDEKSNVFLIRILNRKISKLEDIETIKEKKNSEVFQASFLPSLKDEISFNTNYDSVKEEYLQQVIYSTYDILKQNANIELKSIPVDNL